MLILYFVLTFIVFYIFNLFDRNLLLISIYSFQMGYVLKELVESVVTSVKNELIRRKSTIAETVIELEYFRNLIKEHSIAVLGYCYDKQIDSKLLSALTLKSLLINKKVEINDKKIIPLTDKLKEEERFIIEKYKNIDSDYYANEFTNILDKITCEEPFKKRISKKHKNNMSAYDVIILMLYIIGLPFIFYYENNILYGIVSFGLLFITYVIQTYKEILFSKKYRINTKYSNEIISKLNGLKNYINEFGNFDKKKLDEIAFYDEYMLFAIMLDTSPKLKQELLEEYDNIFKSFF